MRNSCYPFRYTGREMDETGFYYYRARYYSPEMGRFISEDPIGFGGGVNFYAYIGNNPVNFVDPLGLRKCKKSYWQRVWDNFVLTNKTIPGLFAPTGMGILTGGKVAEVTGGTTLFRWASSFAWRGMVLEGVTFTGAESLIIAGGVTMTNFALVTVAFEAGVGVGSMISAAILPCEEVLELPNECK